MIVWIAQSSIDDDYREYIEGLYLDPVDAMMDLDEDYNLGEPWTVDTKCQFHNRHMLSQYGTEDFSVFPMEVQ